MMPGIQNKANFRLKPRQNDSYCVCYYSSKLTARTMSTIAEAAVDDGDYDTALDIMDDPRSFLAQKVYVNILRLNIIIPCLDFTSSTHPFATTARSITTRSSTPSFTSG